MTYFILALIFVLHTTTTNGAATLNGTGIKVDPDCTHMNCPPVAEPLCVRLKYQRASKSQTIFVVMVNRCELKYVSCHPGMEAKELPMKECDHGLKNKTKDFTKIKYPESKKSDSTATSRVKRDAQDGRFDDDEGPPRKNHKSRGREGSGGPRTQIPYRSKREAVQVQNPQSNSQNNKEHLRMLVKKTGRITQIPILGSSYNKMSKYSKTQLIARANQKRLLKKNALYFLKKQLQKEEGLRNNDLSFWEKQNKEIANKSIFEELLSSLVNPKKEYVPGPHNVGKDESVEPDRKFKKLINVNEDEGEYVPGPPNDKDNRSNEKRPEGSKEEKEHESSDGEQFFIPGPEFKEFVEFNIETDDEQGNVPVDKKQYKAACPTICPSRGVMLCAKCKDGVYRTFVSSCHLRMFDCSHPDEDLQLVSRLPCTMSAPYLSDMPAPKGRVDEPGDDDVVLRFLKCKEYNGKNLEAWSKLNCNFKKTT